MKMQRKNSSSFLLQKLPIGLRPPHITSRQTHRSNIGIASENNTAEDYFRRNIFIPFREDLSVQFNERFIKHKSLISSLSLMLPKQCTENNLDSVQSSAIAVSFPMLLDNDGLKSKFEVWKCKWKKMPNIDRPECALTSLSQCNEDFFPNINCALRILATIPV